MAFFLTGALLGAAAASAGNDRRAYQAQSNAYLQSQTLQAQAEARALREETERLKREQQMGAGGMPQTVTVNIPAGVYAGQTFTMTVTSTGQTLQVTVPPGYGPGMPLAVRLPEVQAVVATALPVTADTGRQMWLDAASGGSSSNSSSSPVPPAVAPGKQLLVAYDHVVDESDPQNSAHQIISVNQGEVVGLVAGSVQSGLPAPYNDYVTVRTSAGKVGKVSRFCVQEM